MKPRLVCTLKDEKQIACSISVGKRGVTAHEEAVCYD